MNGEIEHGLRQHEGDGVGNSQNEVSTIRVSGWVKEGSRPPN